MLLKSAEAVPLLISAVSGTMLAIAALTAPPMHTGQADQLTFTAAAREADVASGIPLDRVDNPAATLSNATVQSSRGNEIGRVEAIKLSPDGKPVEVKIATNGLLGVGTLTRSIDARDLLYVRARNALVSRLTSAELRARKAAPIRSH